VASLGPAEQQAVEIAKALCKQARVVIMDEPTASLAGGEIDNLFRLICDLRTAGVAIVYISHRLDEVFQIVNEVTVLRDGLRVAHSPIEEITKEELVKAMVGEEIIPTHIAAMTQGQPLLRVAGLSDGATFEGVDVEMRAGQIVAFAGAQGSGRTQVLETLAGLRRAKGGCIEHKGEQLQGQTLAQFISRGICFVPGERDQMGLIMPMSVAGNITLTNLDSLTKGPVLNLAGEQAVAETYVRQLNIQLKNPGQEVQYLSGGNRQKVMLSKWLYRGVEIFLLDEPTQGVDVGAREEIHRIMKQLLEEGKSIIMVTSDLDELMNMSHVIVVMSKGRVVATLQTQKTTAEEVLSYALGQRKQSEPCA
jgi:ABC-type sugar transport system ATPase subunit